MKFEAVIGLEVHSQLKTNAKLFSSSNTDFGSDPNSNVSEVDLGLPGVPPVINSKAVDLAILAGLSTNCAINSRSTFARKHYFYPDLPKGYQISQYDEPLATGGHIDILVPNQKIKKIRINRVHMEEDVAKLTHINSRDSNYSLLDINRSVTPLMEIVTEPDLNSSEEVVEYIENLQKIIRYIGVGSANMEEGSFRCDANISIRERGTKKLGTKVEIKNMNRISAVADAVNYEIKRQIKATESNEKIIQETRGWSEEKSITISQRTKEESNDYRYFPEPDIPPLEINADWVSEIKNELPELPNARKSKYIENLELSEYDADLLTSDVNFSDFFESVINELQQNLDNKDYVKYTANLMNGEFNRLLNLKSSNFDDIKFNSSDLANLILIYFENKINNKILKTVFEEMYQTQKEPIAIVEEKGLKQITDDKAIDEMVEGVLQANINQVEEYKNGKEKVLGLSLIHI